MVLREGGQNRVKLDHLDMSISVHVEPVKGPRHRPLFEELAQTYESGRHWLYFRVEPRLAHLRSRLRNCFRKFLIFFIFYSVETDRYQASRPVVR